jgi:hypothetical protein
VTVPTKAANTSGAIERNDKGVMRQSFITVTLDL